MTVDKYKRVREIQEYISAIATSVSSKIREGVEVLNLLDVMTRIEFYSKEALEALSKPRNCDVGTADEQEKRLLEAVHDGTAPKYGTIAGITLQWAQMPYEEGEVKE